MLTIVTYHYVRDLAHSRYPNIKALSREHFEGQLRYIKSHYNVIGGEQLIAAVADGKELPDRALLLTFDDGYLDHFTEVLPLLHREGLPGCFFPSAKCILEHEVLDVNKLQFVLACVPDKERLANEVLALIADNQSAYELMSPSEYWEKFARANRFDPAEVVFCKSLLQRELPVSLRRSITKELFAKYVTDNEAAFSRELYMNSDQVAMLGRCGMYVGCHGYDHFWLNSLSRPEQEAEIDKALLFMASVGASVNRWIMCYPHGGYNDSLISVLESRRCAAGLTVDLGVADLAGHHPLKLPRIDTNDLPRAADSEPDSWLTRQLLRGASHALVYGAPLLILQDFADMGFSC